MLNDDFVTAVEYLKVSLKNKPGVSFIKGNPV